MYAESELREHGSRNIDSVYRALIFFLLAVIAGWLGFFGLAGLAAGIAKVLFAIFLVLLALSFLVRALRGDSVL